MRFDVLHSVSERVRIQGTVTQAVAGRGMYVQGVELNDVRHVLAAAVPRRGLTLRQQADDALRTIEAVIQEEGARGSIVHQAVFVPNVNLIDECRQIIRDFYGKEMPATSYVPQPPCEGKLLAIEALGIGRDPQAGAPGEVEIERVSEQLVIARHNHISWCHCAEVVPQDCNGSLYAAALDAFQRIRGLLGSVNIRLDRDTSGVILVARSEEAHAKLASQLQNRSIEKEYFALVSGTPQLDRDMIDRSIGMHPTSGQPMEIEAPLPADMSAVLAELRQYRGRTRG
ncbi:MAG: pseudouridine synthase [Thermoguttaceae bacterium]|jgi:enamine deaminase RidA (YjgF/YER057c/UK114 family)